MSSKSEIRKKGFKTLAKVALGATVAVVCPPAAVVIGAATMAKGAKKMVKTGDLSHAKTMVTGYTEVVDISDDS